MSEPITLYVDGACRGNPGLGGWGVYIQLPNGQEKELCGGALNTTNNRMELTAALEGIKATDPTQALIIWTDSNYVKQGMTEWLAGWKKKNWRKADGKPVINADIWQQLDQTCTNRQIDWRWVKGHAGNVGNERADALANRGADQMAAKGVSGGYLLKASLTQETMIEKTINGETLSQEELTQTSFTHIELTQASPDEPMLKKNMADTKLNQAKQLNDADSTPSQPDWLQYDPLGLDMIFDEENADLELSDPMEEWVDDVAPKTNQEQYQKEQQLEQQQPSNAIKCTPAHLKLQGKRQLILDTETTGFSFKDGDRIIEVGVLEMINRKLTGSSFHVYINPQREVGTSVNVHGITDEFLQDKLLFAQVAKELDDYLDGAEIIAHNATFDMNFLEGEFLKAGFKSLKSRVQVTDTLAIAKRKHPGQKNSLDALVRRYDIQQRDRTFHGALLDAEILADVYLAMTGGQVTLDMGDQQNQSNDAIRHRQFKQRFSIPVITASQQESDAHRQWSTQFEEKNGKPSIWSTIFD